jgi:Holliday junction resolvase
MTESQLTTQILKALRKEGGFWFKVHGSAYQVTGLPDIIGCYKGRFVGFEVKLPEARHTLSKRQGLMLLRIRQQRGLSAVVTSTRGALEVLREFDSTIDV